MPNKNYYVELYGLRDIQAQKNQYTDFLGALKFIDENRHYGHIRVLAPTMIPEAERELLKAKGAVLN